MVSTLTGRRADPDELCSAEYWTEQVRRTVRFADGVRALRELGVATFCEVGPDAALSELSAAIQLDPKSPALRSRAMLYFTRGRFEQALLDFNQVIANDGSDSIAYLDRGATNEKLGRLEDAVRDYSRSA